MNDKQPKKVIKNAKFTKGLYVENPIELTFGISIGNEKQKGADLDSFVNMINRNTRFISKVIILVGAYLHRHYVGEESAIKMHNDWIAETKNNLAKLKIPYEIIDWKEVISTNQFREDLIFLENLYKTDSEFNIKINNISKAHLNRADFETVKLYLLEECAFFKSRTGYFSYPILKLNIACEYVIEKYNKDFHFKGYTLNTPKENIKKTQITEVIEESPITLPSIKISIDENESNPQYLFVCCGQISLLMGKFGIHGIKAQKKFFSEYLKKSEECFKKIPELGKTYEHEDTTTIRKNL